MGETPTKKDNRTERFTVNGKIIRNSIYSTVKSLGSLLFPIVSFSYTSRIFLADGKGRISFAGSITSIFTLVAMLGINRYGIRECAKIRDDRNRLSKLFCELLSINTISALFSYFLLFIFIRISSKAGEYKSEILLYSTGIILGVISVDWLYTAVEDYRYLTIRSLSVQLISLIAVVTFVRKKEDIFVYILISVIASGGNNVIAFINARKYVDLRKPQFRDLISHIRPVLRLFLVSAFIRIFTDMDNVMTGYLSTETEVGLYSASYKISSILCALIMSATTVIQPRMAYVFERHESDKANEILKTSIQYIWMIGLPLTVGACIYSQGFISLLSGDGFIQATASSQVLSIRTLLSPINSMFLLHYLVPRGNEKESIIITSIAALGNVILNACLIPLYGALGASIATVAAEAIELIVMSKYICRYMKLSYVFENIHHYIIAIIPVAIVAIITLSIRNTVLSIAVGVAISVPVYGGMLKLLKNRYFESGISVLRSIVRHR